MKIRIVVRLALFAAVLGYPVSSALSQTEVSTTASDSLALEEIIVTAFCAANSRSRTRPLP